MKWNIIKCNENATKNATKYYIVNRHLYIEVYKYKSQSETEYRKM